MGKSFEILTFNILRAVPIETTTMQGIDLEQPDYKQTSNKLILFFVDIK